MTGPHAQGPGLSDRAEAFDLGPQFRSMWATLDKIGSLPSGGFRRLAWSDADSQLRQWFRAEAAQRQMLVEQDKNGNLWAWWGQPGEGAVATGSHLDSVPDGGAFDGPLGVVAGFLAVDKLRAGGRTMRRPLAVVCFADEEGGNATLALVVAAVESAAREASAAHGVEFHLSEESSTAQVGFDDELRRRLSAVLGQVPQVPTAAGHDAGILSAHVPTAMLFVRNRTGVSHSPAERATEDDCVDGTEALARVLEDLAGP